MGAWGTSLYSSDTALDVKNAYKDMLRRAGDSTNEEITNELIEKNKDVICDLEEAAEFWFALADTQWKLGRLIPFVKEKALEYLERTEHLERWKEAGEKEYAARLNVLEQFKTELLSPMPPVKKISQYRIFKCQWQIGDVFAYQFLSNYSKEKGFYGKYIVFRKVDEGTWHPGHIVPVVYVYLWIGEDMPEANIVTRLKCLPLPFYPTGYKDLNKSKITYRLLLLNTSKKVIPTINLFKIGNIKNVELPKNERVPYLGGHACYWKELDEYVINNYLAWKDIQF